MLHGSRAKRKASRAASEKFPAPEPPTTPLGSTLSKDSMWEPGGSSVGVKWFRVAGTTGTTCIEYLVL
jgi:hypothetical protein